MNKKERKHGNKEHRLCTNAQPILYIAIYDHVGTPLISWQVWIEVARTSIDIWIGGDFLFLYSLKLPTTSSFLFLLVNL